MVVLCDMVVSDRVIRAAGGVPIVKRGQSCFYLARIPFCNVVDALEDADHLKVAIK